MLDKGSRSVEKDLGMEGTEGISQMGALLNNELSGLLDLMSTLSRRDTLPLAWPFEGGFGGLFFTSAVDRDVLASMAGLVPLTWRVDSVPSPASLRRRVFVGDGEGDLDLLIQDFRARLEIDSATEGPLRSACIVPFWGTVGSSGRSCESGSGPIANLGIISGVLGSFGRLLAPSRLKDLLGDLKASSGPFLVEA